MTFRIMFGKTILQAKHVFWIVELRKKATKSKQRNDIKGDKKKRVKKVEVKIR